MCKSTHSKARNKPAFEWASEIVTLGELEIIVLAAIVDKVTFLCNTRTFVRLDQAN